ncbi:hypothetical protein MRX96_059686 [Rhipicephalus microplus]
MTREAVSCHKNSVTTKSRDDNQFPRQSFGRTNHDPKPQCAVGVVKPSKLVAITHSPNCDGPFLWFRNGLSGRPDKEPPAVATNKALIQPYTTTISRALHSSLLINGLETRRFSGDRNR